MNGATLIWCYLLRIRAEQSAEFLLNFESVLAPEPTPNTNSEWVTASRGWGIGLRIRDSKPPTSDRVSKLKLIRRGEEQALAALWHGVPPPLPAYRELRASAPGGNDLRFQM